MQEIEENIILHINKVQVKHLKYMLCQINEAFTKLVVKNLDGKSWKC